MFTKATLFTDIHLGLRNNLVQHNELCIEYIQWMIKKSKEFNSDTAIFLGDFFHNRSSINVNTLSYGYRIVEMLSCNFKQVYLIVGNHDLYYRDQREVHSIKWAETFPNIHIINDITQIDNCLFVPFLVKDEWKQIQGIKSQYVFGHFELPGYKLNSLIEMPDHGKETEESFSNCNYIFSGHFHKRQRKTLQSGAQIHYIGNCFAHNFNDAWDDARGCVLLEKDVAPQYANWEEAPKFRNTTLTALLKSPKDYVGYRVTLKVDIDFNVTAEELTFIRELYKHELNLLDFQTVGASNSSDFGSESEAKVESVDQAVIEQINSLDTNSLDKVFLIEIYESL